jgi:hypothetical protein
MYHGISKINVIFQHLLWFPEDWQLTCGQTESCSKVNGKDTFQVVGYFMLFPGLVSLVSFLSEFEIEVKVLLHEQI